LDYSFIFLLRASIRWLRFNYRLEIADTKEAMNAQYQSEDSLFDAKAKFDKPLISVLSGELIAPKKNTKNTPSRTPRPKSQRFTQIFPDSTLRVRRKKNETRKPLFGPALLKRTTDAPNVPSEKEREKPIHQQADRESILKRLSLFFAVPSVRFLLVIVMILVMSGVGFLAASYNVNLHPYISLPGENSAQDALMAMLEPESPTPIPSDAPLPPLPSTLIERSYTVRRGDTLQSIARQFGLREDTIISANSLTSKGQLQVGKILKIPNMNGIYHSIKANQNLSSISKLYGIDMTRIADANNISSATIKIGDRLFIPNAKLAASALQNFYGTTFIWPVRGIISSPFGYRINPFSGQKTYHSAIDIVVNKGTSVKSTREGKVADTGYNAVFGNYIILRHSDGYQSMYAHLDQILTKKGLNVNQGEVIGRSGNTGQSTGPHLHFSIFRNGQAIDPLKFVK